MFRNMPMMEYIVDVESIKEEDIHLMTGYQIGSLIYLLNENVMSVGFSLKDTEVTPTFGQAAKDVRDILDARLGRVLETITGYRWSPFCLNYHNQDYAFFFIPRDALDHEQQQAVLKYVNDPHAEDDTIKMNRLFWLPHEREFISQRRFEAVYRPSINQILAKHELPDINDNYHIFRVVFDVDTSMEQITSMFRTLKDFEGVIMVSFVSAASDVLERPNTRAFQRMADLSAVTDYIWRASMKYKAKAIIWHGEKHVEKLSFLNRGMLICSPGEAVIVRG